MREEDFTFLASLLKRRSGYVLEREKTHLLNGRLKPVLRRYGFKDLASLIADLRHGRDTLARAVAEAMTVNDSNFFRDIPIFDHLYRTVLPEFIAKRSRDKKLRIWCAAVSSGQEAYSVAMMLDALKLVQTGWTIDLIATDINPEMITRAESGLYADYEVERGVRTDYIPVYFRREGDRYRIAEHLRRMVSFRSFNLLDSYGWLDDLDIVLCRNVLMYFDDRIRAQTLDKITEILKPDGALILGATENLLGLAALAYEPDGFGVYRKAPNSFSSFALSA